MSETLKHVKVQFASEEVGLRPRPRRARSQLLPLFLWPDSIGRRRLRRPFQQRFSDTLVQSLGREECAISDGVPRLDGLAPFSAWIQAAVSLELLCCE
jgi:hypothetical protein